MIKKILFSFWDGGTGHFIRVMSVAQEAFKRGIKVGFITSEKYLPWIQQENKDYKTYVIPNRNPAAKPPPYPFPLYSHTFGHAQRLNGLRFDDIEWLERITKAEIKSLHDFKPDLVINDYRDTIRTSAQVLGIPVVGITHSSGNVDGYTFGWWIKPPKGMVLPDCRESFNTVRRKYSLYPIQDERETFSGDINILPSIPEVDPLVRKSKNSFYVGLLSSWKPIKKRFTPLNNKEIPKVFSYVGEKSRPQYGYEQILSKVIQKLDNIGFYVVGDVARYKKEKIDFKKNKARLQLKEFIPAESAIRDSELIMNHGGHGTLMIALSLGKPIICVGPYHSDCTTVFREIEKQGAGIMINHSNKPLERMRAPDLGKDVEIMGYWHTEITSQDIERAILRMLNDPRYKKNAQRLSKKINALHGTSDVIDICIKFFG